MSARGSFRRLLGLGAFTEVLLLLAMTSPLLAGALLTGEVDKRQEALLACLFLPTPADWPAHTLSYSLAILLAVGTMMGTITLITQWYKTRFLIRSLLKSSRDTYKERTRLHELLVLLHLEGRVDLVQSLDDVAFCYGWLKPRICISSAILLKLDPPELNALLLHERYHLLHRDPLKTAMARALTSTLFFLPLVRGLQQQYLVAKEIEADRHVISNQGTDRPLLRALYKLLRNQNNSASAAPSTYGGAEVSATDALNQRLDYLLNGRTPTRLHKRILFLSSIVLSTIGAVLVLATWAAATSAIWYQAHSGLGGC